MITTIINFGLSNEFRAVAAYFSFFADFVLLVLSLYTLYITKFSKNIELISPTFSSSLFYGTEIGFTLMNKTLHTIPIQSIFIMKRYKGEFLYFSFDNFESPIAIDSWSVKWIRTKPFTNIYDLKSEFNNYHELLKDSVIGIRSGSDYIWLKTDRDAPLSDAKKIFNQKKYRMLSVYRNQINGTIVSVHVNCVIKIRIKNVNGQYELKNFLGVLTEHSGRKSIFLNEALLGFNSFVISDNCQNSIAHAIHEQLNINLENICVNLTDGQAVGDRI